MKNIHIIPTNKPSYLYKMHDGILRISDLFKSGNSAWKNQNIYITSDEKIREGDWYKSGKFIWQMKYSQWGEEGQGDAKKIILTTDQELIDGGVQAIDDEFLAWFLKNSSCENVEVKSEILYEHIDTHRPYPSDCKNLTKTKVYYYLSIIPKEESKQNVLNHFLSTSDVIIKDSQKFDYKNTVLSKEEPKSLIEKMKPLQKQGQKDMDKSLQETLEEAAENYSKQFYFPEDSSPSIDFQEGAKWQSERMYSEEEILEIITKWEQQSSMKEFPEEWFEQFKKI